MVKNKRFLYASLALLLLSMVFSFPFPHEYPVGEALFTAGHMTIITQDGWNIPGLFSLALLISGMVLLTRSMKEHAGGVVLAAFLFTIAAPSLAVWIFQKTLASGIYALSYDRDESHCSFESTHESTITAECELPLKNHSGERVDFRIHFYDTDRFQGMPTFSLLSQGSPYHASIGGNEEKTIKIRSEIGDSRLRGFSGHSTQIPIIIRQGKKVRKL